MKAYIIFFHMFPLQGHPNADKICLLASSAAFQQHFHDWFCVRRYNSAEHHYYLTPTKSVVCLMDANFSLLRSQMMLRLNIGLERLELNYYSLI